MWVPFLGAFLPLQPLGLLLLEECAWQMHCGLVPIKQNSPLAPVSVVMLWFEPDNGNIYHLWTKNKTKSSSFKAPRLWVIKIPTLWGVSPEIQQTRATAPDSKLWKRLIDIHSTMLLNVTEWKWRGATSNEGIFLLKLKILRPCCKYTYSRDRLHHHHQH